MTRITFISLSLLLFGLYACKTVKPKVIGSDDNRVEVKVDTSITLQDTMENVILPTDPPVPSVTTVPIKRQVDTLLFQAADLSTTVVGQRNPLGVRQGSMKVNIPVNLKTTGPDTKDSLIAFAYWIGVGEQPIVAYDALVEEVPQEWSQPGVSAPLAAYVLKHPIVLPGLGFSEERFQREQVRFDFVDLLRRGAFTQKEDYTPLFPRDPNWPNFGIVSGEQLQSLNGTISQDQDTGRNIFHFYFAYANQHAINSYLLQLKVVAFYEVYKE
ncbi:hypothetical protein [Neolewinella persica]|uniref:hypothetical protein n=1 Tax=Neolewinella persica TaxID=70998 RepID=UPI0004782FC4|nr:hypothetical protein [Neolewinella persica]